MKLLSKENAKLKTVWPSLLSILGIIAALSISHIGIKIILIFIIVTAGFIWIRKKHNKEYNFLYNDQSLILKSKNEERFIGLKEVRKIKLTLSDMRLLGVQYHEYQVEFINEMKSTETQNFYISTLDKYMWDFQDLLRQNYPDAIIENHVNSRE